MNPLINVFTFLIHILFTLYIYIVLIRIILGYTRADFYNPFSQFIVTMTTPILQPMRKLIPSIGRVDTAAIVLVIALKFGELFLIGLLNGKVLVGSLILPTIFGLIDLIANLFIFAIIVLVIISWVAPHLHAQNNPLTSVLRSITDPLIRPARKLIPPIGIFDFSTFAVLIALFCVKIFFGSFQYY